MSCRKKNCDNDALYGKQDDEKPKYCEKHKKDGYVIIKKQVIDSESDNDDHNINLILHKNDKQKTNPNDKPDNNLRFPNDKTIDENSIKLLDKIKELIDKNMENFKLTGKCIISEKVVDELLKKII